MSQTALEQLATPPPASTRRHPLLGTLLPGAVILFLVGLAITNPVFPSPVPPEGGIFVIGGVTIAIAILVRWFRHSYDVEEGAEDALPNPLYTLYLAAIVIGGVPEAVLLAALIPFVERLPELIQRPRLVEQALRVTTIETLNTFVAGLVYLIVTHGEEPHFALLHSQDMWVHVIAALTA